METGAVLLNSIAEILSFMGSLGIRYSRNRIDDVFNYMYQMAVDGRILTISDESGLHSVVVYSICNDYELFWKKKTWEYKQHDPEGTTIYVEKAVSKGWNRQVRDQVTMFFLEKYPQFQIAKWHRWGKKSDREVTVRRPKDVSYSHS